jgi:hypothetical protein
MPKDTNFIAKASYYLIYFLPSYLLMDIYVDGVCMFNMLKFNSFVQLIATIFMNVLTFLSIISLLVLCSMLNDTCMNINTLGADVVKIAPKNKQNWYNAEPITLVTLLLPTLGCYTFLKSPALTLACILIAQFLLYWYQYRHYGFCHFNYGLIFISYSISPVEITNSSIKYIIHLDTPINEEMYAVGNMAKAIPLVKNSNVGVGVPYTCYITGKKIPV